MSEVRLGIAVKLGLLLTLFAVTLSGLTGYYLYRESRTLLLDSAQQELMLSTQVLAHRFTQKLEEIERHMAFMAQSPLTLRAFSSDAERRAEAESELAGSFTALMLRSPEYVQIRLIGAAEYGKERVRVDRGSGVPARVPDTLLQEKGHYPYVFKALRLAPGELFLSRIGLNKEINTYQNLQLPTLFVAMPVHDAQGTAIGVVVVNVDVDRLFGLMRVDLPNDVDLYMTNAAGDYLIHPDASQTFGFDRGRRIRIQDSVPEIQALLDGQGEARVLGIHKTTPQAERQVAVFVRVPFTRDRGVLLGLARPYSQVVGAAEKLRTSALNIGVLFAVLALLLALAVARVVTRPLAQIMVAVRHFAREHVMHGLPVQRRDEIGLLARTLNDMQSQVGSHLSALRESHAYLDHLARHDPLTGLPNRLMFFEQLDRSISAARRSSRHLAVLFVDLDHFKAINDNHGHEMGDRLLKTVADTLVGLMRKEDTVARLGATNSSS